MQWGLVKSSIIAWIAIIGMMMGSSDIQAKATIILIDSQPVLVDLGPKGEIYERYVKIPEYFRSRSSHEGLVSRYKRRMGILSKVHKTFDPCHFLAADHDIEAADEPIAAHVDASSKAPRPQLENTATTAQPKNRSTYVPMKEEYRDELIGITPANKEEFWYREDAYSLS